jgi:threonine/homoserine/homoserine lactone efflux protein
MATRSFCLVTFLAMLVGIGFATLVQSSTRHDFRDPRATVIGMCVANGIGCGAPSGLARYRAF